MGRRQLYSIIVERCPERARTVGRDAEVTETVARESACEPDIVDMRPGPERGHRTRAIPPAPRRAVMRHKGGFVGRRYESHVGS